MIVLGIDQAATSGWAIARRANGAAKVLESGTVRGAVARRDVIARAVSLGEPLAAVYEAHTVGGGRHWNPATILGMGDARGRWLEALELAGVPRRLCIGVEPYTWRAAMIGRHRLTSDAWKAQSMLACSGRGIAVASDDEAEAVLIALWGAQHSAEIAKIAGKR